MTPGVAADLLDVNATTAKRAQWEAFEFTIIGEGDIEVVNGSHEEPEEHTYTVHVKAVFRQIESALPGGIRGLPQAYGECGYQ